jgi:alcohol dehydrogenase
MKAFVVEEIGRTALATVADPQVLASGDAVLRVTTTSICGSDLHLVHGALPSRPPYSLGHEYVGVVEEVGAAVTRFAVGDRVVGPAAPWCGACPRCRAGQIQAGMQGGVFGSGPTFGELGGAMAERIRVPFADTILTRVPDGVADELAVLVGDVLSTGMTGVRQAGISPGDVLLVIGCGPVGLSAVHTARLFGPSAVIAVDRVPGRLAAARALGATHTLDASTADVAARVAELTDGRGASGVVEAVGLPETISQAVDAVGVGGRVAVVGIPGGGVELPMPAMVFKNVTLWTGLGHLGAMDALMALLDSGVLDPSPMITHQATLDELPEAFAAFSDPANGVIKTHVRVSG